MNLLLSNKIEFNFELSYFLLHLIYFLSSNHDKKWIILFLSINVTLFYLVNISKVPEKRKLDYSIC